MQMIVEIPWNAWFGEETLKVTLPPGWQVDVPRMGATPLEAETIAERIIHPIAGPPLREAARGKQRIGIAVDDISRPTPVHELFSTVMEELHAAAVSDDNIFVFIASGAHRAPLRSEAIKKIGADWVQRLKIVYHNPFDNLANLGRTTDNIPILINKNFVGCDYRVSIGGIMPHNCAGFSSGYKTTVIGLGGIEPLYETHVKRGSEFVAGAARIQGNRFQAYLNEAGNRLGIDFAVNVAMTARRRIAAIFAGEPESVFTHACQAARDLYSTPCGTGYDVAVLNAYPKDLDLTQAMMALKVSFSGNESLVREGGTVVLTTPAIDGAGVHYIGGENMLGYKPPKDTLMKGRRLVVYSPGLSRHDVRAYLPRETLLFHDWDSVAERLTTLHPAHSRACVVECASLQLVRPIDSASA